MRIVSIGEVLWDVIGEKEYLGGAALNFAAHAARLGHTVFFVSAVGKDERGRRVLERMAEIGLSTRYVREVKTHPTGVVTVELDPAGVPRFTLHHPAAYDAPELTDGDVAELLSPKPDWIYFGTLFQMSPQAKQLTYRLIDSHCGARLLYDVNLRRDHYTAPLVRELMARGQVVKLNEEEAARIDQMFGRGSRSLEDFCRVYAHEFGWQSACVTRGEKGCAMLVKGEYVEARWLYRASPGHSGSRRRFRRRLCPWLELAMAPGGNRRLRQSRRGPRRQPARRHPALDPRRSAGSFEVGSRH